MTSYRNPGFIKYMKIPPGVSSQVVKSNITRQKRPSAINIELPTFSPKSLSNPTEESKSDGFSPVTTEFSGEILIETRKCSYCEVNQPLRSKHCAECNNCVALHDHHCPWLGVCIGQRTKCFFWWYLLLETILLLWTIVKSGESLSDDADEKAWALLVFILTGPFCVFTILMLFYHSYLAVVNQTTWENLSWGKITYLRIWPRQLGSPFSRGIIRNLKFFCVESLGSVVVWKLPDEIPELEHKE